jgi:hypothetical protein
VPQFTGNIAKSVPNMARSGSPLFLRGFILIDAPQVLRGWAGFAGSLRVN